METTVCSLGHKYKWEITFCEFSLPFVFGLPAYSIAVVGCKPRANSFIMSKMPFNAKAF